MCFFLFFFWQMSNNFFLRLLQWIIPIRTYAMLWAEVMIDWGLMQAPPAMNSSVPFLNIRHVWGHSPNSDFVPLDGSASILFSLWQQTLELKSCCLGPAFFSQVACSAKAWIVFVLESTVAELKSGCLGP